LLAILDLTVLVSDSCSGEPVDAAGGLALGELLTIVFVDICDGVHVVDLGGDGLAVTEAGFSFVVVTLVGNVSNFGDFVSLLGVVAS
jgi:hypothetical protein